MVSGWGKAIGAGALIALLSTASMKAYAQYIDWIGYGPGGEGRPHSVSAEGRRAIAFDGDGNRFVAGWVQNRRPNPLIVKYDAAGAIIWQRRISTWDSSQGQGVVVDASGNALLFATGDDYPESAANVVKYSPSGEQLWALRVTDEAGDLFPADVVVASNGDWYLLGVMNSEPSPGTSLSRYSSAGTLIWRKRLPDPPDSSLQLVGSLVELDGAGNAYICATARQQNYSAKGASVMQVRPDGNVGWERAFSAETSCADFGLDHLQRIILVTAIPSGAIVHQLGLDGEQRWATTLALPFHEPMLAIDSTGDLALSSRIGLAGSVLARMDGATGAVKWTRPLAPANSKQAAYLDPAGRAYVVGRNSVGSGSTSRSAVSVSRLDVSGNTEWTRELTAPSTQSDDFASAAVTQAGGLTLAGDDRIWPYQLMTRQVTADGNLAWTSGVLPQQNLPQRVGMGWSSQHRQALIATDGGYFSNSSVWDGERWLCHVDGFSKSGQLRWSHTTTAPAASGDCEKIEIAADRSGSHYTGQLVAESCPGTMDTRRQFVLNHHDAEGRLDWQQVVWDCADPLQQTDARVIARAGAVYVVGRTGEGSSIVAYASNGDVLWRQTIALSAPYEPTLPFRFDPDGNLLFAGLTPGHLSIVKVSPEGAILWRSDRPIPEGDNFVNTPKDLTIGSNGDIAVIVRQSHRPSGWWSLHVVRTLLFAPDGSERWSRLWSSPVAGQDDPTNVVIDAAGNVVVSVESLPYIDENTRRDGSAVVVRYGRDGTRHWERFVHSTSWVTPRALAMDNEGNAWIVMDSGDYTADFERFIVAKVSDDGRLLWTYKLVSDQPGADHASAAVLSDDGALVIAASIHEHGSTDKLALIKLTDRPRADGIFTDGFDFEATPVSAHGSTTTAQ